MDNFVELRVHVGHDADPGHHAIDSTNAKFYPFMHSHVRFNLSVVCPKESNELQTRDV
jgi:hypothetical protein